MSRLNNRLLTQAEKVAAFMVATGPFARTLNRDNPPAMTDDELAAVLQDTMGIFAGRAAPGQLHLTWQGAGLKIWASWHVHNHVTEAPAFKGLATIAMARECYGIQRLGDRQMRLL